MVVDADDAVGAVDQGEHGYQADRSVVFRHFDFSCSAEAAARHSEGN